MNTRSEKRGKQSVREVRSKEDLNAMRPRGPGIRFVTAARPFQQ